MTLRKERNFPLSPEDEKLLEEYHKQNPHPTLQEAVYGRAPASPEPAEVLFDAYQKGGDAGLSKTYDELYPAHASEGKTTPAKRK